MLGYSMTRLHVLFVLLLNVLTHGALRQDDLLLQHLLSNYSASGVAGFPNPVNVSVGIALKRIQVIKARVQHMPQSACTATAIGSLTMYGMALTGPGSNQGHRHIKRLA